MIKTIKFTIMATALGIVGVIAFDLAYLATMFVTSSKEYSVNMGIFSNILMIIGLFADCINNFTLDKDKEPKETDLTPKGFKPAVMPEDAENQVDPNKRQVVDNSKQVMEADDSDEVLNYRV